MTTTYNCIIHENPDINAFYVVDLAKTVDLYFKWNTLLPNVKPYYAIKCNSNPRVLKVLENLGVNFDCASQKEIQTILDITHDSNRIIFANPCKIPSHIKYAKDNQVSLMTFDCAEELYKINTYYPEARLVLRLVVDDSHSIIKFSKKFGCSLENVESLLNLAKLMNLNVVGFSFHVGSKCLSSDTYYNALCDVRKACDIAINLGNNIEIVDIGGGFSSLHDFEEATFAINRGIQLFSDLPDIHFIAEPGRYFVETTHTLVLQIIGKKNLIENDSPFMIYTLNESVYNSFNCTIFDCCVPNIRPLIVREGHLYKSRIYGYTCDSMDLLLDNSIMPNMEIGDWVYVEKFGAYTYSASSQFNGFQSTQDFFYVENDKN